MTDSLDDQFRPLRDLDVPGRWEDVEERAAAASDAVTSAPPGRRHLPLYLGAVAAVLTLVVGATVTSRAANSTRVDTAQQPPMATSDGGDSSPGTPVGAATHGEAGAFYEVVPAREANEPMGSLHAAVDQEGLRRLWSDVGVEDTPPDVDLERWVVVSLTVPASSCPPRVTDVDRRDRVLEVLYEDDMGDADACPTILLPKTLVVAVDRNGLDPSFELVLPASDSYDYEEQRLVVDVPPRSDARPVDPTADPDPCSPYMDRREAQQALENDPSDPEGIDPDGDGRACETLADGASDTPSTESDGGETPGGYRRGAEGPTQADVANEPPYGPGAEVGETYDYVLYTHCGIEWARIDGVWWQAIPLDDGRPSLLPAGWGDPYDAGELEIVTATSATYRGGPDAEVEFERTGRAEAPFTCQ